LIWERPAALWEKDDDEIVRILSKMPLTCLKDACVGGSTLEEVAKIYGVSREMVRKWEERSLRLIRKNPKRNHFIAPFSWKEDQIYEQRRFYTVGAGAAGAMPVYPEL
jgi:acetyl-CoA acetyltransferase